MLLEDTVSVALKHYKHNNVQDLLALRLEMCDDLEFIRILDNAHGRRIIVYWQKEHRFTCDPPLCWKYGHF